MARRKGSKNRTTLERELRDAGDATDLSKLSYDDLASKADVLPKPEPAAAAPEPVEQPIVDPAQAKALVEDTRRRFQVMVDYYTKDGDLPPTGDQTFVPERIQEYLRGKVFMAGNTEEARHHAHRALEKLHSHLLTLWGRKRISGPYTAEMLKKKADKAEKWAKRLAKLGKHAEAEAQRAKVAALLATPPQQKGTPWLT